MQDITPNYVPSIPIFGVMTVSKNRWSKMGVDVVDVDEAVQYGEDRQSGRGMYVQFGGYIAAVGSHGIDGDKQFISYLLVLHAACHTPQNVFLPVCHIVYQ